MAIAQELTIDTSATAEDMFNLIFGEGIQLVAGTATYSGDPMSSGIYSGALTTIEGISPTDSGVILSTGNVAAFTNDSGTADTNTSAETTTDTAGVDGDADLDALAGVPTFDGAILTASFIPVGDYLTMQFVFSSEEYPEYVNQTFNDAFGVWINGEFVPVSVTVQGNVSINSVNEGSNANLYIDNTNDQYNTEMDGFTYVLSFKARVTPDEVNTIKIAIADGGDAALDSNLLIMASSMQTVVLAIDDQINVISGSVRTFDIMANDTVANGGLSVTQINGQDIVPGQTVMLPSGQQVRLNADGTITVFADGMLGEEVFSYTVSDGTNTDIGYVTLNTTAAPTPDGIVSGTSGDDVIDTAYLGDPDGDLVDANDATGVLGTTGDGDVIYGGGGNDSILSGNGADFVEGGDGADTILAGSGNDSVYGGNQADWIDGGTGNDTLEGDDGNDTIHGSFGSDVLYGGAGADLLIGDEVPDGTAVANGATVAGTAGRDGFVFAGAAGTSATIILDNSPLTPFDGDGTGDVVHVTGAGNGASLRIEGFDYQSDLVAVAEPWTRLTVTPIGAGNHLVTLIYADGSTQTFDIFHDNGAEFDATAAFVVQSAGDTIRGGDGDDTILGNGAADSLSGDAGSDLIEGGAGNDWLDGGADNDTLDGGAGADTLTGGAGNDRMTGGAGNDTFVWTGQGNAVVTDFGTDDGGPYGDGNQGNNDFVDLRWLFNDTTLAAYNSANGTSFAHPLMAMNHDLADGRIDFNGTDMTGPTLTLGDGPTTLRSDQSNVICFVRGTRIKTDHGEIEIEDLCEGDRVLTLDNGYQPIRWIGSTLRRAVGAMAPVQIDAGVLGNDRVLRVSPQHRMLLRGWQAELMFGEHEVLATAKSLLNDRTIRRIEGGFVEYFHILFDRHQIIFAEGAPSESFHPGQQGWKALDDGTRNEVLDLFPELAGGRFDSFGMSARLSLRDHEGRVLARALGV